jgi:hypothetical protein
LIYIHFPAQETKTEQIVTSRVSGAFAEQRLAVAASMPQCFYFRVLARAASPVFSSLSWLVIDLVLDRAYSGNST